MYLSSDAYPDENVPVDLVRYDLVRKRERGRVTLPLGAWWWANVDYDGTRVLVTPRESVSCRYPHGTALLFDVGGLEGSLTVLDVVGRASFAK